MRMGLIGTGRMGDLHAGLLVRIPEVELSAVIGHDEERTQAISLSSGACAMRDVADGIGLIDAAIVAVPASVLAASASVLLEAGVPCLIEKPVVVTPAEYDILNSAAHRGGTFYAVGLVEHFSPAVRAVANALRDGGQPAYLYHVLRSSPDGGRAVDVNVVTDLLMHDLEHARRFLHGAVRDVTVSVLVSPGDLCDHAAISLRFNCAQADIVLSRAMACPARTAMVSRPNETFVIDLAAHEVVRHACKRRGEESSERKAPGPEHVRLAPANPLLEELKAFCADVRLGRAHRSVAGQDIAELLDVRWEVERQIDEARATASSA